MTERTSEQGAKPAPATATATGSWRSRSGSALVGALLTLALVVSFGGWGTSGSRTRNSYELVRSVRTLELLDGLWATLAPVWFALPLAVAVGVIAAAMNWRFLTAGVGLFVGCLLIVGWLQLKNSILGVDAGAKIGVVNGIALIASSVVLAAISAREHLSKK